MSRIFLALAAPDELNDLQLVAVRQHSPMPVWSPDNLTVAFHGDSIRLHRKQRDQATE